MNISPLHPFLDVLVIEPLFLHDERGHFSETFREDVLEKKLGYPIHFCQDNQSKSSYGILRGLHYQLPPFAQTKLVQVIKGHILDVIVDLRKGSSTFLKHASIDLNEENKKQLYVPRGFAHGFVVLSTDAIVNYKVDNYYSKEHERGIKFDDPNLGIDWKLALKDLLLSPKDQNQPLLKDAELFSDCSLYD